MINKMRCIDICEWGFSLVGIEALYDYPEVTLVVVEPVPAWGRRHAGEKWFMATFTQC